MASPWLHPCSQRTVRGAQWAMPSLILALILIYVLFFALVHALAVRRA